MRVRQRPGPGRRLLRRLRDVDPLFAAGIGLLVAFTMWAAAPLATGATSQTSDTTINLSVPSATAVVPGLTAGDTAVEMPAQSLPGEAKTATSSGWRISTSWANGYQVTIRATSDPALRGDNSTDRERARSSFADHAAGACPCPWTAEGNRGVFGYSVEVSADVGPAPLDADKWAGPDLRWRGFTNGADGYEVFRTPGGTGQYAMNLKFRTEIPEGAVQTAGTYRSNIILGIVPLF